MTRPFFITRQRKENLKQILDSWLDTPFRHWAGVKGVGCDCIHFVGQVMIEAGVVKKVSIFQYPPDWHLHNEGELLYEGIKAQLPAKEPEMGLINPMNGDIILYRFGKASSHCGIYYAGYVYQSINGAGVQKMRWTDRKWFKRRTHCLRVMEETE